MSESHTPVLIAGGSLVGLSTALFLAHHGVSALLVERHPSTSIHPRAVGYYPRTVELLRSVGLEEAVGKAAAGFATHTTRAGVESLAGRELFSRDELEGGDELADLTPCRMILLPQDRLEPLLRARAEELGARLRFGVRLASFEQGPDGVTAQLVDAEGNTTEVTADYLVGADGPRSLVRETLGIERHGAGVLSNHVSIAFEADMSEALRGRRFSVVHVQNPDVTAILVHDDTLREGTLIVGYDPAKGESLADFTDERCEHLVRAAVGDPSVHVRIRSYFPWDMAELVAERFVDGRVLLAGDAAHVIPPTGGYGANTGIADAYNLAWKLAAVLDGRAGAELLASYDDERRPVGDYVAGQGSLQLAVRSRKATPEQEAAAADPLTVTMGLRYGCDPIAVDPRTLTGEPGTRAPYVPLPGETSTLDFFGAGFALVTGDESWLAAAEQAAAKVGVTVAAHRIPDPAAYGIGDRGASLVRPDGVVTWRTTAPAAADDLVRALESALRR
jgi:putative polyketide hydroxylase